MEDERADRGKPKEERAGLKPRKTKKNVPSSATASQPEAKTELPYRKNGSLIASCQFGSGTLGVPEKGGRAWIKSVDLAPAPRDTPSLDRDFAHPTLSRVKQLGTCPSYRLAGHSSLSSSDITAPPFQRISALYVATAGAICFHGGQGTSRHPVGQVLSAITSIALCPLKAAQGTVTSFPATSSRLIGSWLKLGCLDLPAMYCLASLWHILAAGKSRTVEPVLTQHSGAQPGTRGTKAAYKSLGNAGCPSYLANVGWKSQTGGFAMIVQVPQLVEAAPMKAPLQLEVWPKSLVPFVPRPVEQVPTDAFFCFLLPPWPLLSLTTCQS
ncbi:hypothetical protein QR685DRAFT_573386 [Neurospora intermedia]|uniref:Uncharacterized protein n=1 Tax=Neurospora intermedia TaxID=5142 RepID=A0ABR3D9X7_NEUIN